MTERQALEGTKTIIARRRLTEEEVRERLIKVYKKEYGEECPAKRYAEECIRSTHLTEVWTDSTIGCAVVYNASTEMYIIISTGEHYELVEV